MWRKMNSLTRIVTCPNKSGLVISVEPFCFSVLFIVDYILRRKLNLFGHIPRIRDDSLKKLCYGAGRLKTRTRADKNQTDEEDKQCRPIGLYYCRDDDVINRSIVCSR